MSDHEKALYDALIAATKACVRLGYNPTYTVQMIHGSGPLGACQRVLATAQPSEGFTRLWELHRLDLSMEAIVLRPEFSDLFTAEGQAIARQSLANYGFTPPSTG
jgi:hypothetical protein